MIKKTLQWPKKLFIHKKNPAFVKTFKKGFFIRIYLIGCFVNMEISVLLDLAYLV